MLVLLSEESNFCSVKRMKQAKERKKPRKHVTIACAVAIKRNMATTHRVSATDH